jgi:streptogramin lyase
MRYFFIHFRWFAMGALTAGSIALSGCALDNTAAALPQPGVKLEGSVKGGQEPVSAAEIFLLAAGSSGYGGSSISLISSGYSGTTSLGNYVLTDAHGGFTISGDYACTPGQQVYVLALGGNPGLGAGQTNSALALMAVLGSCPAQGNFLASTPTISINEVTTVAAAYALSGFMIDATHVSSSGTALSIAGLADAFGTVANLVNIATGAAYSTSPSTTNGSVPQAEINTLGNMLQGCVNSSGDVTTTSSACYRLFTAANNGTMPANTVEAALSIAKHPGNNVGGLFALVPAAGAAFAPALVVAPNDWTVAITFSDGNLGLSPVSVAVDGFGNVWVVAQDANSLVEYSYLGVPVQGTPYTGFSVPSQVVLDATGSAWVVNSTAAGQLVTNMGVTKIAVGAASVNSTAGGVTLPLGAAVDASNNIWTANQILGGGNVSRINDAGTAFSTNAGPFGGTEEQGVQSIAIDASGDAWTTTGFNMLNRLDGTTGNLRYSNTFSGYTLGSLAIDNLTNIWIADPVDGVLGFSYPTQTMLSGSPFTGGGIQNASGLALDGAGNVWVASYAPLTTGCTGKVAGITNAGVAITPSSGYTTPALRAQANGCVYSVAVDGSGNIWYAGPQSLTEFVGAAVPVHTPVTPSALSSRP